MSSSTQQPLQILPTLPAQPFRLDVPLHDLLQKRPTNPQTTPHWRGRNASLKTRLLCPRRSSRSTRLFFTNSTQMISPRTMALFGPANGTGLRRRY